MEKLLSVILVGKILLENFIKMINRYMEMAANYARTIDDGRNFRLAALAIRTDGVIVKSTNLSTQLPQPRGHAEARVMLKAGWGSTVYVARVMKNGELALSKPCANCERMMRARGVKKVYYSISQNEYGCLIF